ncbi:MAG: CheR family methyltransferase [Ignavibacteriaceae bacterium]
MIVMTSEELMSDTSELIAGRLGLNFPKERWSDLDRGLSSAAKELGFKNAEATAHWFLTNHINKNQIEILASHLTIGETYFFRDIKYFEILEEEILPKLISSRRKSDKRIRIWSAGCSSGEESYSIAMLLNKMIPDLKEWNITILATDINPKFLKKANEGIYTEWSFRNTPTWVKEKFFINESEKRFKILPSIKKMVNISYLNLAEDNYPSLISNTNAMDIVFCRNVLMYFVPELANKVVLNLHKSLIEGGWLIVNPAETSFIHRSQFNQINYDNAILYQRYSSKNEPSIEIKSHDIQFETKEELFDSKFGIDTSQDEEIILSEEIHRSFPESVPLGIEYPNEAKTKKDCLDLFSIANDLYKTGQYEEAGKILLELFSKDQLDSKTTALLARIYANKGKLEEAFNWCKKAISSDKLNPAHYYLQATILQELGNKKEAITFLKQTLYLDHNFVMAYLTLGNLTSNHHQPHESKRYYRNALLILNTYAPDEILPYSEGITAGRLSEIIGSSNYLESLK